MVHCIISFHANLPNSSVSSGGPVSAVAFSEAGRIAGGTKECGMRVEGHKFSIRGRFAEKVMVPRG